MYSTAKYEIEARDKQRNVITFFFVHQYLRTTSVNLI